MNIEIFTPLLAALLLFRLLSPMVDRLAGWLWGSATHAYMTHSGSATADSIGSPKTKENAMATYVNCSLLDLEWDFPQVGVTTIRGYLCAVLARLWQEQDSFTFKRAFGFSHWQRDLLPPLIEAKAIDPIADDLHGKQRMDALVEQQAKLEALIASLIPLMANRSE